MTLAVARFPTPLRHRAERVRVEAYVLLRRDEYPPVTLRA
jgi:hypothetical protein